MNYEAWKADLQSGRPSSRPIRPHGPRAERQRQAGQALQAWAFLKGGEPKGPGLPGMTARNDPGNPHATGGRREPEPTVLAQRFPRLASCLFWVAVAGLAGVVGLIIATAFGWKPTPSAFPHFVVWLCGAFGIGAIGHAIIYGWDRLSTAGKLARFGLLLTSLVLLLIFAPRDHSKTTIFSPVPIGDDAERPAFDFYAYDRVSGKALGCKVAGDRTVPLGSTKWCPVPVEQDHGGQDDGLPLPTPKPSTPRATPTARPAGAAAPTDCRHKVFGKCPKATATPAPAQAAAAKPCPPAFRTSRGDCP